ncbi:MAG TPA: hypothetical protein VG387_08190 [Rhizomicrobium sp.]|nr:hypothetical protein [Rhizomicrobium sp.]
MKPIAILGLILLLGGFAGLIVPHIGFSQTTPVLKAGPLEVDKTEDHYVWIPVAASVLAIAVGAGLIVVGRRA